jgi:hypothetical protein
LPACPQFENSYSEPDELAVIDRSAVGALTHTSLQLHA